MMKIFDEMSSKEENFSSDVEIIRGSLDNYKGNNFQVIMKEHKDMVKKNRNSPIKDYSYNGSLDVSLSEHSSSPSKRTKKSSKPGSMRGGRSTDSIGSSS